jgi:hypothetical protein
MRWVTRSGPHVDRMASAWLIRRFVDPKAEFCFTADPDDLPTGATPFDMRGVELSHQGENCTFETIMERYGLADPALDEIAVLVHEADLADDRFYAPAAPGLDLVTRGISLVCDDQEALRVGMQIFEGLYAHSRQKLLRRSAGT